MINMPPASRSGRLLNAVSSAIPRIDPATVSGNMLITSTVALKAFLRRTTRYAIMHAITTITTIEIVDIRYVIQMELLTVLNASA